MSDHTPIDVDAPTPGAPDADAADNTARYDVYAEHDGDLTHLVTVPLDPEAARWAMHRAAMEYALEHHHAVQGGRYLVLEQPDPGDDGYYTVSARWFKVSTDPRIDD